MARPVANNRRRKYLIPLYDTRKEPGLTASESTALMTTIAISAVGQETSLSFFPDWKRMGSS
jgi:hypothetical protein